MKVPVSLRPCRCHALQLVAAAAWLLLLLAVVPPLPVHSAACLKPCYPGNVSHDMEIII